jgi:dihydroorotate dehydrogenase electron transfer subunit
VGEGTRQLSERKIGDVLSIIGPIGNGFKLTDKKRPLLIGGGVGMPPMIAIAQQIKDRDYQPFTILGSEVPFPFDEKPADNAKDYAGTTHTMPLLVVSIKHRSINANAFNCCTVISLHFNYTTRTTTNPARHIFF